jgi:hypothetical protein
VTILDLVNELLALKEKYGDLPVVTEFYHTGNTCDCLVDKPIYVAATEEDYPHGQCVYTPSHVRIEASMVAFPQ